MPLALPDPFPVPSGRRLQGSATIPTSKSIAHRALILAALAAGSSTVAPVTRSEDVEATLDCLRALGIGLEFSGEDVLVHGSGGRLTPPGLPLDCRASGTTLRLLMGVCGSQAGAFTLDGEAQLRRRPVADLEGPLAALGASVRYAQQPGHAPVVVEGRRWSGGTVQVQGRTSSQYLSGLLMAAPLAAAPVTLVAPDLVSRPYAEMTAALMARFGARVERPDAATWAVVPANYGSCSIVVEPDASAAAFLWAGAAVTGGQVLVKGTAPGSLQGDAAFPGLLAQMGCRVSHMPDGTSVGGPPMRGLDADVRDTPDLVPALVAVACFAPAPTRLSGVSHLRFKESDRLSVLADSVAALGGTILLEEDCLTVIPTEAYHGATLDPHGDHRMAMAFSVMGLRVPGVAVRTPACVGKSFPDFFEVLQGLCR